MSLSFIRGAAGVMILFLGRELSFLFSGAMAAFIGFRLTPLLPSGWPVWSDTAFVITLAVIAGAITLVNQGFGYYFSGFLIGGYVFSELYAPNSLTIPLLPFFVGSVLGAVFIGLLTDWAMIIISTFIGTYIIYGVLPMYGTAKTLASAGIFVVGAIAQVVLFQMQKHSDR